jgi:hypothetical protein
MTEHTEEETPTPATDEPIESSAGEATPSTEAGPEPNETATPESETPPVKSNRAERRIATLTARAARAEEKAEYWRDQALRAKAEPKPSSVANEPQPPKRPTFQDFGGDYEQFAEALGKYTDDRLEYDRKQRDAAAETERRRRETSQHEASLTERQQKQLSVVRQAQSLDEDFAEQVETGAFTFALTDKMLDIVTDMDKGAAVLVGLMARPEEAARIAGLKGNEVALELAKFALAMSTPKPKGSGAPPPPKPPKGSSDPADQAELRDDLSMEEWARRYKQRFKRKA